MLEDPKRVAIIGDSRNLQDTADLRLQNGPQSKTQPDCAPPSEMIRFMNSEKEGTNSSRDIFWKRIKKTAPFASNDVHQATFDGMNVFALLMEPYKFCTFDQVSHTLYSTGGEFRHTW